MRDLQEIRQEINEIDEQLIQLFIRRMNCAKDVAVYKKATGLPILNAEREQEILDAMLERGGEYGHEAQHLYTNVMELSRALQHNIIGSGKDFRREIAGASKKLTVNSRTRVATQGLAGANNHEATKLIFGSGCSPMFHRSFKSVFKAIQTGEADYGVLPVENSSAGSVSDVYDLILQHRFYIVNSLDMPICHNLCCIPQSDLRYIEEVWSHPQALAQCSDIITQSNYRAVSSANTAIAAKDVALSKRIDLAAICNESAAREYGLKILKKNIANRADNTTRFIVISKQLVIPDDADKISLCFSLPHRTGSLYSVLSRFNAVGLNLTKIESRPRANAPFQYLFYLDFIGNIKDRHVLDLISALSEELPEFSFLGNYLAD